MADYVAFRKGRNALSNITHIFLNIALAVMSTALTVISNSCIFGILLVLLSKWRVIAVRPRYWWLNIKANLVDFTVGISLVLLVYMANSKIGDGLNAWHIILTVIYAVWLVAIKPRSEAVMTEIQAVSAIFLGTYATSIMAADLNPIISVVICFVIGYGATRHVLVQSDDHDFSMITFICGLMLAELAWIFYHWVIVYRFGETHVIMIPQLPIIASVLFFMMARGYKSAIRHDGKIRADDIVVPAIFSVLVMVAMVFFFSAASFNV